MAPAFRKRSFDVDDAVSESLSRESKSPSAALHVLASSPSAATGVSVDLVDVSKTFGTKQVLSNVRLSVKPGEFIAIVGRSGCGKSTLLRLLAGLDGVSEGSLQRQDRPVKGIDHTTRFMFQDARLLPWSTVLDNVKIGLSEVKSADAERRAYSALKLVGLEDRANE